MFIKKIIAAIIAVAVICSLNFCEAAKKIVAVMPLENVSGYSEEKVAEIMTEQLIVAIHSSGAYTVVERPQMGAVLREQGFQNIAVDPSQAVELGKLSGAQYTMVGKVTMAVVEDNPTSSAVAQIASVFGLGDIGEMASQYVHKFKGKIGLEFRFVDNTTGEIVIAGTVEGNKSGSSVSDAFNNACKNAAENFIRELDSLNPFRATVAEIYGADIYIDKGSEAGLRLGEILTVAREGTPIVVNGKIVAVRQDELCKIKIVELNPDYAICRLEGNSSVIHKGDVVKRS
ncbi:MAG: hypothetical protein IJL12_00550 [Selenomonadaceae bacterium]|nr:hypothetical protein [Selenomonadaceae bacterium]MBQ4405167.1 hypothetical protein [Selenomonadaceae bacterium]MBQ6130825.1 hypothetical protein [Selenomonadaceae bacterium]